MLFTCLHVCAFNCLVYLGINLAELLYNRARNYLQGCMRIMAWHRYQIPHINVAPKREHAHMWLLLLFEVLMSIKRVKCMHLCMCVWVYTYVYTDIYVHMYAFDSITIIVSIIIILLIGLLFFHYINVIMSIVLTLRSSVCAYTLLRRVLIHADCKWTSPTPSTTLPLYKMITCFI